MDVRVSGLSPLLIELGTEELPVKALPGLAQAFFDGFTAALGKREGEEQRPATREAMIFASLMRGIHW